MKGSTIAISQEVFEWLLLRGKIIQENKKMLFRPSFNKILLQIKEDIYNE